MDQCHIESLLFQKDAFHLIIRYLHLNTKCKAIIFYQETSCHNNTIIFQQENVIFHVITKQISTLLKPENVVVGIIKL